MALQDSVDQYFTRSIVGTVESVTLGASDTVRTMSTRDGWVEVMRGRTELVGRAAHSLLAADPATRLLGWPLQLQGLVKLRRRLLGTVAVVWTLVVAGLTAWALR